MKAAKLLQTYKEIFEELTDILKDLIKALAQFITGLFYFTVVTLLMPLLLLYSYTLAPFQLGLWYEYYFTNYYQNHINEQSITRLLLASKYIRDNSLSRRNERKWLAAIIKRYRKENQK